MPYLKSLYRWIFGRKYYVDIMHDEMRGRTFTIRARSLSKCLERAYKICEEKDMEYVYQICVDKQGHDLPQPIWDFMNLDIIYEVEDD